MIEWKNAKKELPEESGDVLVYYGCGVASIYFSKKHQIFNAHDWYSPEEARNSEIKEITHWAYINKPGRNHYELSM